MNPANTLCLRQGYPCDWITCQIWIKHQEKELNEFFVIDVMMPSEERNLYQIYERLRAECPNILQLHYSAFEDAHVKFKAEQKEPEWAKLEEWGPKNEGRPRMLQLLVSTRRLVPHTRKKNQNAWTCMCLPFNQILNSLDPSPSITLLTYDRSDLLITWPWAHSCIAGSLKWPNLNPMSVNHLFFFGQVRVLSKVCRCLVATQRKGEVITPGSNPAQRWSCNTWCSRSRCDLPWI